jgi:hypothetical protein
MKTAVTSIIDGGIGNQMFQYAAARALSAKLGADLELDLRRLNRRGHRKFDLAGFSLASGHRTILEGKPSKPPGRLSRMLRSALGYGDYFLETSFPFNPEVLELSAPVILDGYFQSERYFIGEAELIRADFQPRAEHAEDIERIAREALPAGLSVSLHVRRGDYVEAKNQAFHGLVPLAYYDLAMAKLTERLGAKPTICVFTDDTSWVRANLTLPPETRYVSELTSSALEDLILMSRCSHHITANSSFSWWGAWLNPNSGKIVITPAQWFQPSSGIDTRDLRPSGWLVV